MLCIFGIDSILRGRDATSTPSLLWFVYRYINLATSAIHVARMAAPSDISKLVCLLSPPDCYIISKVLMAVAK